MSFQAGSEFTKPEYRVRDKAKNPPREIIPFSEIMADLRPETVVAAEKAKVSREQSKRLARRQNSKTRKKPVEPKPKSKITVQDRSKSIRSNMYGQKKSKVLTEVVPKKSK